MPLTITVESFLNICEPLPPIKSLWGVLMVMGENAYVCNDKKHTVWTSTINLDRTDAQRLNADIEPSIKYSPTIFHLHQGLLHCLNAIFTGHHCKPILLKQALS